ncbi:MAG TPA: hypothetical protein VK928_13710 [Longimicrobiales bacterium]|nr:hypothetical protein [Longimicrobiales bacterium]
MMRALVVCVVLLGTAAAGARAQCLPPLLPPGEQPPCRENWPAWTGEVAVLGANALLGGVSAGINQKIRGGSFRDAFLGGLAGGAFVYGGKRIAAERFGGAGLVGREVAALGGSMVRNAGDGIGLFDRVVLPLGVARLYVERGGSMRLRADLVTIGWLAYALTEDELEFDPGMSLSSGAFAFRTNERLIGTAADSVHASGITEPGIMFLADVAAYGREYERRTFEHERIHILQLDQIFLTITNPVEDAALKRVPYLSRLEPYVDINLSSVLMSAISSRIPKHLDRPWETEAIFFSR